MEIGDKYYYLCQFCGHDCYHKIVRVSGCMLGVSCSNCGGSALLDFIEVKKYNKARNRRLMEERQDD